MIEFAYLASLVPALLFVALYLRSRWTATLPGRTSMVLAVVIVVALSLGLYRQHTGELAPEGLRLLVFMAIAAALWFQAIALLIVQNRSDDQKRCERCENRCLSTKGSG